MRTTPSEVMTDDGGPTNVTHAQFVQTAIEQGRLHPQDRAYWLYKFSQNEEAAADELLARRPVRALSARSEMPVNQGAYLDWMRQLGVVGLRDDPRVRPSWAH